ncbi:MAG: aminodeoxychorismate/anthranilate synthase component II [Gemmatimonadales bacterium]
MILLIDHDDSFVHILAGYVATLGSEPLVIRVSALTIHDVDQLAPSGIILSPGPGAPEDCALALDVVRQYGPFTPVLGVCLGHQCIATSYGGAVDRARLPRHGMTSPIEHDGRGVFTGIPSPFSATRYHALVVRDEGLPNCLVVTARATDDGEIMGIRHRTHPVEGVQFHPESVLTQHGHALVENFLSRVGTEYA